MDLPENWIKCFSSKRKQDYFFNTKTKKSLWTLDEVIECENSSKLSNENKIGKVKLSKKLHYQFKPIQTNSTQLARQSKESTSIAKEVNEEKVPKKKNNRKRNNKKMKHMFKLDSPVDKKTNIKQSVMIEDTQQMEVDNIVENVKFLDLICFSIIQTGEFREYCS